MVETAGDEELWTVGHCRDSCSCTLGVCIVLRFLLFILIIYLVSKLYINGFNSIIVYATFSMNSQIYGVPIWNACDMLNNCRDGERHEDSKSNCSKVRTVFFNFRLHFWSEFAGSFGHMLSRVYQSQSQVSV